MCFDKCLRGRVGICGCGCSTRFGVNIIYVISLLEVILFAYLFFSELATEGEIVFNLTVLAWLAIGLMRVFAYLSMCFDTISKRKCFMWTLVATTAIEVAMFVILNVGLIDGDSNEETFPLVASWDTMGSGMQIAFIEVLSMAHLAMFSYFCAIAYEYYCLACDDPKMIEAEHNIQADREK